MSHKKTPFTVLIEGNIGCGKTTLLNYFAPYADIFKEPVDLWQNVNGHNLLDLLYTDPQRWATLFQTYVMLTAIQNHLESSSGPVKLIERSVFSSHYCFAKNFFNTGQLHKVEYQVLNDWFQFLITSPDLGIKVDLIIYLRIQPEKALERIKLRGRVEESNISLVYLQKLHNCYDTWLLNHGSPLPAPVIVIDANQNMAEIQLEYLKYKNVILGKQCLPQE